MASERIKAHAALWAYLLEIQEEIQPFTLEDPEPLVQLFGAFTHYLHPSYKFEYILELFGIGLEALELMDSTAKELLHSQRFQNALGECYGRIVAQRVWI